MDITDGPERRYATSRQPALLVGPWRAADRPVTVASGTRDGMGEAVRRQISRRPRGPADVTDRLVSHGPQPVRRAASDVEVGLVAMMATSPTGIRTAQLSVELAECTQIDEWRARRLLARALVDGSIRLMADGRRVTAAGPTVKTTAEPTVETAASR